MKWCGAIGFNEMAEVERGVWDSIVNSYPYFGDLLQMSWREQQGDKINADISVSNRICVVADPRLQNNFQNIAYVTFGGAKWTVSNVEFNYPRVTLSLGSLYLEESDEE